MPGRNELPSYQDIVVHGGLDGEHAAKNFYGKDLKEAEALFRDNFLHYAGDLMWMGPKAFCFYVEAAIAYLLSGNANEDSDAVNSFLTAVRFQNEHSASQVRPAYPMLQDAIGTMLKDFDRYKCDLQVYGDLRYEFEELLQDMK